MVQSSSEGKLNVDVSVLETMWGGGGGGGGGGG